MRIISSTLNGCPRCGYKGEPALFCEKDFSVPGYSSRVICMKCSLTTDWHWAKKDIDSQKDAVISWNKHKFL